MNNLRRFNENNTRKLSGKEVGKPYDEWTETEKIKGLLDLAIDGFQVHLGSDKLKSMSRDQIINKCAEFHEWFKKLR